MTRVGLGFICLALTLFLSGTAQSQKRPRGMDMADDMFQSLERRFTLRFFDAVTGKPLVSARARFEGQQGFTGPDGSVTFEMPKGLSQDEKRMVRIEKPGYVPSDLPVRFLLKEVFFNRFSVSPALEVDRIRVVLDWGRSPTDLDAHLVKEGSYHISFQDMKVVKEKARLDRDDRDGEGPETITVLKLSTKGTYQYFVQDFTKSGQIGSSRASVKVYGPEGLLETFEVPDNAEGNTWMVFQVVHGGIVKVNQVK